MRGKDIDVYIGGYDPSNPLASAANKWTGVQAATIEWRVTQEVEEEFGNYFAVSRDFDVPTVTGTIDILPRHADDLFKKIREITGVSETNRVIGATTAVPLPLDIVIKDGENGGITLKRFHVKDARFSVPGYSPRPEQNVTMTLSFESDGGSLEIYRDLSAPIVKFLDPAAGEAADEVRIFGVNFVDVTDVEFDGVPATSFTVDSGRQITAGGGDVNPGSRGSGRSPHTPRGYHDALRHCGRPGRDGPGMKASAQPAKPEKGGNVVVEVPRGASLSNRGGRTLLETLRAIAAREREEE